MNDKTEDKGAVFDVKALNQTYQEETGQVKEEVKDDNRKMLSAMGTSAPRALDLDDIADTFCEAWPKAKMFFNIAFKLAAWMPGYGSLVVMAKGVIKAIDKTVVPVICGTQAADDAGGVVSNSSRRSNTGGAVSGGGATGSPAGPTRRDPINR